MPLNVSDYKRSSSSAKMDLSLYRVLSSLVMTVFVVNLSHCFAIPLSNYLPQKTKMVRDGSDDVINTQEVREEGMLNSKR